MKKIFLISFLLIFVYVGTLTAQKTAHSAEVGPFIGTSYYMGEINQTRLFYQPSFAFGGVYRHNIGERKAIRIEATYAKLRGADSKSKNTYQLERDKGPFSSNVGDIALLLEFNFLPYDKHLGTRKYYTPYVLIGCSFIVIPEPRYPFEFAIPFGVGFKYALTKKMSVGFEWTYRYTFTDNLDEIEKDSFVSTSDGATKQMSYNPHFDMYSFAGLVFTYQIFRTANDCPSFY